MICLSVVVQVVSFLHVCLMDEPARLSARLHTMMFVQPTLQPSTAGEGQAPVEDAGTAIDALSLRVIDGRRLTQHV